MRTSLCLLMCLGFAAAAYAGGVRWTVPGWYQVLSVPEGEMLWQGPFGDEASCKATLPANDESDEDAPFYQCEYLGERPAYDDN